MTKGVILVAVDFEEASMEALNVAEALAKGLGTEVALVHVYQIPTYTYPGLDPAPTAPFYPEIVAAAQNALDQLAKSHGVTRSFLREGDQSEEILAAAAELGASMIVMGTHGRRGLSHVLLGSVAEKVVRQSPVPVVTVRAPSKD